MILYEYLSGYSRLIWPTAWPWLEFWFYMVRKRLFKSYTSNRFTTQVEQVADSFHNQFKVWNPNSKRRTTTDRYSPFTRCTWCPSPTHSTHIRKLCNHPSTECVSPGKSLPFHFSHWNTARANTIAPQFSTQQSRVEPAFVVGKAWP